MSIYQSRKWGAVTKVLLAPFLILLLFVAGAKVAFSKEANFFSIHAETAFFPPFQGTYRNGNYSVYSNGNGSLVPGFPEGSGSEWSLAMSPPPSAEAKYSIVRPKNLVERARMNVAWVKESQCENLRTFPSLGGFTWNQFWPFWKFRASKNWFHANISGRKNS